jgi:hypothetical protein
MKLIRRSIAVAVVVCAFFVHSTYTKSSESNPEIARAACSSQFRYLKQSLHAMDLKGPPVVTDGYTTNIAEAEWPFMAIAYYGYACANIAQFDEAMKPDAIAEMRWALNALQTPRLSGFMEPHFGPPFGEGRLTPAVFVHGHFLNLAVRYREVTGDTQYDALMERIAKALDEAYTQDELGVLLSYKHPPMWWLTDNFPALSALARYDRIFHTHYGAGKDKFLASLKDRYLDPKTGMFCTYADPESRKAGQGPRGISMMYGLHFLNDFAPDFAKEQYALTKKYLFGTVLGCSAVREFPKGQESAEDIDSGPLVMGFGPSASGFGIAATAVMDDTQTGGQLLRSLFLLGLEVRDGGKLSYRDLPDVGQAVILFGRTEMLKRVAAASKEK